MQIYADSIRRRMSMNIDRKKTFFGTVDSYRQSEIGSAFLKGGEADA